MNTDTASTVTTMLLGPGGALLLMVLGGKWLMGRLEKADEERRAQAARMETLISDNTKAMGAMVEVGRTVAAESRANAEAVQRLVNGMGRHETDPGLRVVQPTTERNG